MQIPRIFSTAVQTWRGNAYFPLFLAPFLLFPLPIAALQLKQPLTHSPDAFVKSLCSAATSTAAVVGGTHLK